MTIPYLEGLRSIYRDKFVKNLFKNSVFLFFGNSATTVLQFVEIIILTRFLQQQGYGLYVLITTYVMMINQFFDVRIAEAATKYGTEFHAKGTKQEFAATIKLCYAIDFLTGVFAFVLVFFTSKLAAHYIVHKPEHYCLINLYALTLLISTLDHTSGAVLKIFGRFKLIMTLGITMSFIQVSLILAALFLGKGLVGVIIAFLVKDFINAVANALLSVNLLKTVAPLREFMSVRISQLNERVKEIVKFIFHTNIVGYFRMVNTKLDVMILGYFRSPQEVGLYKLGIQISSLPLRISDPFYSAILPDVSRLWAQNELSQFRKFIVNTTQLVSSLVIPFALLIFVFRNQLVMVFAGSSFLPSSHIVAVALWAFVISSILFWVWPVAMSMGRADFGTMCSVVGTIIQVVTAFVLVPRYGGIGSAVSLFVTYVFSNGLMLYLNRRHYQFSLSTALA